MQSRLRPQSGFTLIELMIVVAIIGILVTIAIPNLNEMRLRAYDAAMKTDVHNTFLSIEDYRMMNDDTMPPSSAALEAGTSLKLSSNVSWDQFNVVNWQAHPAIDFTLAHSRSPDRWGSIYPSDPTFIEAR